MALYLITTCVHYTDLSSKYPSFKREYFSDVISAKTKVKAKYQMERKSLRFFNKKFNRGYSNIFVLIYECYEV